MSARPRPLREDDLPDLIRLRQVAFGSDDEPDDPEARARLGARLRVASGIEEDGRLVAAVVMWRLRVHLAGRPGVAGGLAGVVSDPVSRRRGHIRTLVLDALERLADEGVGWSLEHPFDPRFYGRMGYRSVPNGTALDLPIERLPDLPPPEGARRVDLDGLRAARPVHAAFAARHLFAPTRDDAAYGDVDEHLRRILHTAGEPGPRRFAWTVPASRPGSPAVPGATLVASLPRSGGGAGGVATVRVHDVAWSSPEGRRAALGFLRAFRGQAERVEIHLPAHDPLVREWGAWHAASRPVVQARIVDLGAALGPLRLPAGTPAAPPVLLRVRDDTMPRNDGTWRVRPGPDGTEVERAAGAPAVTLDVRALVSLLAGAPPEALAAAGEVEGDPAPLRALAATTAGFPPFLPRADFF